MVEKVFIEATVMTSVASNVATVLFVALQHHCKM